MFLKRYITVVGTFINRASSVAVAMAVGWCTMQISHQLLDSIGCHVSIRMNCYNDALTFHLVTSSGQNTTSLAVFSIYC